MSTQSKALVGLGAAICVTAVARQVAIGSGQRLGLTSQQAVLLLGLGVALSPAIVRALR
jgi:hypothetical protein